MKIPYSTAYSIIVYTLLTAYLSRSVSAGIRLAPLSVVIDDGRGAAQSAKLSSNHVDESGIASGAIGLLT